MSSLRAPLVVLNSKASVPTLGLGTWKSATGEVQAAVETALSVGYRHIDCSPVYNNEKEIGAALTAKLQDGTVKRDDIFVTSKLWNACHRPDNVEPALRQTLSDLQLQYLDLFLIHWPNAWKKVESGGKYFDTYVDEGVDYVDTWRAMEKLVEAGLTKSIGLSNFNSKQIQRVLDMCTIKPAMLQVEIHPYLPNIKLVDFCKQQGITVTAYSPFASPDPGRFSYTEDEPCPLSDDKVKAIAAAHNRSPAQVILRWLLQRDVVVIPKSVKPDRIRSNLDVFDFSLRDDEMQTLSSLDVKFRCCKLFEDSEHYPFFEEF